MSDRTTVMYYYDGTYNGFLSCVFESFAEKETPAAILPVDEADQTCLFGAKYIETDLRRAERVRVSIPKKMGMEAQDLLERAFFYLYARKGTAYAGIHAVGVQGRARRVRATDRTCRR